jgi:hypothetical protein
MPSLATTNPANETKPGIYTTEFWVTIFTSLLAVLDLSGAWDFVPDRYATILLAVVNAAYAVSRGIAKQGVKPTGPPSS